MLFEPTLRNLVLTVIGSGAAYAVWSLLQLFIIRPLATSVNKLPGPSSPGIWRTHSRSVMDPLRSPKFHDDFVKSWGKTIRIQGMTYVDQRILTLDARAINHVLNNNLIYEKPWQSRRLISSLIGNGLLSSEGLHHKKLRKVMNPAFAPANMKSYAPLFLSKAHELRRRWLDLTKASNTIDMVHWLSRATFDVIGLAGFDYAFNAIKNEDNEVYLAYKEMFDLAVHAPSNSLRPLVSIYIPWIDRIWPTDASRVVEKSHKVIYGVGNRLVQKTKQDIIEGKLDSSKSKSLLALLVKQNLSETNPTQRITDEDIMNQINTFFFAGSDTTSLALAFTLEQLAQNPDLQKRLREEILAAVPDADENLDVDYTIIDSLPFLDHVCRESLRLIPPVHSSLRVALQDDVLPTQFPVTLRDGTKTHSIPVPKGTMVHIPMEGFNLDKTAWGEDAWEFRPDRWDNLPETAKAQPGLWANMLTFSAGPRSCIGMKFSVLEMKTFLFVLISTFSFQPVPNLPIRKVNIVLTRPFLVGKFSQGSQLPLILKPLRS